MQDDLISVIIPIYNVEKYLSICVDSVISQSYKNLEIILVNDGSQDGCGEICDDYAKRDSRIKVIHQKNGGLSKARNSGIEIAQGSYISFIDSDDFISEFFIEILYNAAKKNNADIATTGKQVNNFVDGQEGMVKFASSVYDYSINIMEVNKVLELMLYQNIPNGAQFRIYKKTIFDDIRYPVGWVFEDVATVHKAFIKANKIALVNTQIYAYRVRPNSIVRMKYSEAKMVVVPITQNLYKEVLEYDSNLLYAVSSRAFAQNYHVFLQIPPKYKENMDAVWNEMKKYRGDVLKDHSKLMRRKNKIGAISTLFGENFAYYIGRVYIKIRRLKSPL